MVATAPTQAPDRPHVVENDAYTEMLGRMIAAFGRRVADGDTEDLRRMMWVQDQLLEAFAEGVDGLREQGFSWADIARPLGTTRQAAQQRFG